MTVLMAAAAEQPRARSCTPEKLAIPTFGSDAERYAWVAESYLRRMSVQPTSNKIKAARDLALLAFDISLRQFTAHTRDSSIPKTRQKIVCLICLLTKASRGSIARAVERDHMSVLGAVRKYQDEIGAALGGS
jgi:chromosomal replication initiation ATPase DnaA